MGRYSYSTDPLERIKRMGILNNMGFVSKRKIMIVNDFIYNNINISYLDIRFLSPENWGEKISKIKQKIRNKILIKL